MAIVLNPTLDEMRDPDRLSPSSCKKLVPPSTPADLLYSKAHRKPPTTEMMIGSVVHLVMDVGAWDSEYAEAPDERGFSKRSTKTWEAYQAELGDGVTLMHASELRAAEAMALALSAHPAIAPFLSCPGDNEVLLTWEADGVPYKCVVDRIAMPELPSMPPVAALEYKTDADPHPDLWSRKVANMGYQIQAAMVVDAVEANLGHRPDFYWPAVRNKPPHLAVMHQADELEMIRPGRELYRRLGRLWLECKALDRWPGYPDGIHLAELPGWAR